VARRRGELRKSITFAWQKSQYKSGRVEGGKWEKQSRTIKHQQWQTHQQGQCREGEGVRGKGDQSSNVRTQLLQALDADGKGTWTDYKARGRLGSGVAGKGKNVINGGGDKNSRTSHFHSWTCRKRERVMPVGE